MDSVLYDLRYACRSLVRTPGFTAAAVLTLALGIGANTAIFQLIDAVALRTLPVENPSDLVEVRIVGGNQGFGVNPGRYPQLTRPVWEELRRDRQALSGMFAWKTRELGIGERENLRPANGIVVTGEFFQVLGVEPYRGRLLEPADETACPETRAVVSHAFWQRRMNGRELDGSARLKVNGQMLDIIGVTPPGFFGVAVGEDFDIAMPLCRPAQLRAELFDIAVMGRLRAGWTAERASTHITALSAGIFEATAPTGYSAQSIRRYKAFRMAAYPAASGVSALRKTYDVALRILFAITGLILLLACANLANLMLARASARDREMAVRVAMGASRLAIVRQCFAESCLLAGIGAVPAIALARLLGRIILWALSTQAGSPTLSLATNWHVLAFTAGATLATCIFFGVAPAVRAARIQPAAATRTGGRGTTTSHERLSTQRLMVATQVAISLVMLVAALLFVRSFRNLMTFDPGMREDGIVSGQFGYGDGEIAPERYVDFRHEVVAEIKSIPGIENAGTTTNTPLLGGSWSHGIQVGANEGGAQFTWVSPGYFDTMGIPIVQGRDFTLRDTQASPRVAVVNREFIRRLIGEANPIGLTLKTSPEPLYPATVYEIVGVIPNTKYNDVRGDMRPMVFAPDSQCPAQGPGAAIMIHSNVRPDAAIAAIRQRMRERFPGMVSNYSVFRSQINDRLVRERLLAMLAAFFGVLAMVLTMVGLYGMLSYTVSQRRPEIGVRIALGAERRHVIGLIMREAAWMLAIGVVLGAIVSLLGGRSASALLFGLKPNDPLTLGGAIFLLGTIAAVASFLPARRASHIDPAQMLRES